MMGLGQLVAANTAKAARMAADMPTINGDTPDKMVASLAKLAMNRLDTWLAETDRALVGRQVVRTRGALKGTVTTINGVCIANGASGYHLFVTAPVAPEVSGKWTRDLDARYAADKALLELGVTCELLAVDDVPA